MTVEESMYTLCRILGRTILGCFSSAGVPTSRLLGIPLLRRTPDSWKFFVVVFFISVQKFYYSSTQSLAAVEKTTVLGKKFLPCWVKSMDTTTTFSAKFPTLNKDFSEMRKFQPKPLKPRCNICLKTPNPEGFWMTLKTGQDMLVRLT